MEGDLSKSFRPEDFASYLKTKEPVLIVGGQAVNLWGYYYEEVTQHFGPLVSKDMDILGLRKVLEEIASQTGMKPQYFSL